MGIFRGNIFGTGGNPFEAAARGEFFVPIGDEDHPPLARRLILIFCAFAVLIGGALFANRMYKDRYVLPERNTGMIGHRIDEVEGVPDMVAYAGVDFDYEVTDFEGIITGCRYTAKENGEALNRVISSLLKRYGSPDEFDKMELSVLDQAELASLGTATWTWNCGKHSEPALEKLDNWGSTVAGYYINPTYLYMDLIVTAGADGEVDILICYEVRHRHT